MKRKPKIPAAPEHFSDRARLLWREAHVEYELSREAVELLRVACENMDLADSARAALRRDGFLLEGPRGAKRISPLVAAAAAHDASCMRALRQLGLDVVARDEKPGRRATGGN
jgi:phage terminase small subunit